MGLALILWNCDGKLDPALGVDKDPGTLPPGMESWQVCYSSHVEPILRESCIGCHSRSFTFRKDVTLDDPASVRKNLDRIVSLTGSRIMPPRNLEIPESGRTAPPLSGEERAILRAWRDNGARDCGDST